MNLPDNIQAHKKALEQWAIQFLQNVARSDGQRGNIIARLHDYEGLDEVFTMLKLTIKERDAVEAGTFNIDPFYDFLIEVADSLGYTQFIEPLKLYKK